MQFYELENVDSKEIIQFFIINMEKLIFTKTYFCELYYFCVLFFLKAEGIL